MTSPRVKAAVLADDLTGALATAACLRGAGRHVTVGWRANAVPAQSDVLVVDMRTRDHGLAPRATALGWARQLATWGCRQVELRTDSTLRGEPGQELDGLLEGVGIDDPVVVAVPAYPCARRTVVEGRLHVDGQDSGTQVGRTVFGDDETATLGLTIVRNGADVLAENLRQRIADGWRRLVIDGQIEGDIQTAAHAVRALGRDANVRLITMSPGAWLRYAPWPAPDRGYVLVVVASGTDVNRAQLDHLASGHAVRRINARALAGDEETTANVVADALFNDVAFDTLVVDTLTEDSAHGSAGTVLSSLAARAAGRLLEAGRRAGRDCSGLVVTGGHTASVLMDVISARRLDAGPEIEPLCPSGLISGGDWSGLPVITKGGLIGDFSTLTTLVDTVRKEDA